MAHSHSKKNIREGASTPEENDEEARELASSHVVQCMQCDLQFQADTVIQEGEKRLVDLHLPEGILPIQREIAEQMYEHEGEKTLMALLTQPLREEHKELLPHIEGLRTVADTIGMASLPSVWQNLDELLAFLTHQLMPHAQAEERVLYPTVGKVIGATEATAPMSHDHRAIERLTHELETLRQRSSPVSLSISEEQSLRRILYGLYALVKEHFAKEEEIYLPLLDARLTSQEAQQMFHDLEIAAREAKSHIDS
jgi:iron-sulfur cluster repair protein YtfE (RIC family)